LEESYKHTKQNTNTVLQLADFRNFLSIGDYANMRPFCSSWNSSRPRYLCHVKNLA